MDRKRIWKVRKEVESESITGCGYVWGGRGEGKRSCLVEWEGKNLMWEDSRGTGALRPREGDEGRRHGGEPSYTRRVEWTQEKGAREEARGEMRKIYSKRKRSEEKKNWQTLGTHHLKKNWCFFQGKNVEWDEILKLMNSQKPLCKVRWSDNTDEQPKAVVCYIHVKGCYSRAEHLPGGGAPRGCVTAAPGGGRTTRCNESSWEEGSKVLQVCVASLTQWPLSYINSFNHSYWHFNYFKHLLIKCIVIEIKNFHITSRPRKPLHLVCFKTFFFIFN